MVTREDLTELSAFHDAFCISIYIPTSKAGEQALKGEDSIKLKNQLKDVKAKLELRGLKSDEINKFVQPVQELVADNNFWRHQSDGLALFISEDFFRKFSIPVSFTEFNYVSSEFYLKPLLPLFNDDGVFYLLTLKKDEVRFYEGSKFSIGEIDIDDIVPARVEERVGYDYEEKQLQFRTQWGRQKPGSFHGHGESESRDKIEMLLFLQAVDKGLMTRLKDRQEPPLILCCLDKYYSLYREANTYRNLFPDHIAYNPADLDTNSLHEKARELVAPHFRRSLHMKKEKFEEGLAKGKASSELKTIISAAVHGRADTLFIDNKDDIFGVYDPATDKIVVHDTPEASSVSLTNLAAKKAFEQGGTVWLMDASEMPDNTSKINALFRY